MIACSQIQKDVRNVEKVYIFAGIKSILETVTKYFAPH